MQSSEPSMQTPYKLAVIDTDEIERAITGIAGGFAWCTTPQGHDYWAAVYRNLLDLETQARMIEADNQPCLPSLS